MFFAYCFFYNKFCQKLNIFFKLNHFNFNELNVIGQLNCILYRLYLYLSLFILFLNLFCGFNFNVIGQLNCILYRLYLYLSLFILFLNLFCGFNFQQLFGKAMVILIPVPHGKPCRYHGSHFQCVSRSDWFIENWIIKKNCGIFAKKIADF